MLTLRKHANLGCFGQRTSLFWWSGTGTYRTFCSAVGVHVLGRPWIIQDTPPPWTRRVFTSPEVSSSLCFQGNSLYEFLEYDSSQFWVFLQFTFAAKEKNSSVVLFFHYVFVPSRRPFLRTCRACTCLRVSVPPHCTGCPSHVVWCCSCLAAVQKLSSEKTLSVSCTVGHSASHFMALLLLYCCYLDVLFCKTRISQLSAMIFRPNISQNFLLAKSCRIESTCVVLVQINFPF